MAIHPLRESASDIKFHPLTNRFSTCPDLSVKDDREFADSTPHDQTKDLMTSPALMAAPNNSNLRNGITMAAKQATEKLKWKFLGW